ncbi:Protein of unknown function (DUF630 and DUF632) [Quillaja saponaria]|uniref:Nitrate regulatory gene2 protein-like n=1 Tax=Quillaja saponaria TaxID=32244 RepID=A0AAD7PT97_QUISA|nr:Protein of unknown function (DUF630 and DUF632) [Quillaja saponaria]
MGCTSSKLDDLPAVVLCRERCTFIDEATYQRYALAQAHIAYIHSLKGIGHSLHHFIQQDFTISGSLPFSPQLNLPLPHHHQKKGDHPASIKQASGSSPQHHSHSKPGSHLHFHSDSEEEDDQDELGSLHHSGHSSPDADHAHIDFINYSDQGGHVSMPGGFMHMNFMKNKATPSVVFEQRPISPQTVYMGETSLPNTNPNAYPYYGYPNYGGGTSGLYGSPPPYGSSSPPPQAVASSSKPPPPPPPPPRASAWDFFNPFESFGKSYSPCTPSRDWKELRDEEGIPDLEDEDYQHEVVQQVHGDQKLVDDVSGNHSKPALDNETEAFLYQTKPGVSMENDGVEYEVHVVEKKVVGNDDMSKERGGGAAFKGRGGPRDVFEFAKEVEIQFVRASEAGTEIAKMLEVGKLPYHRKHGFYQASSKMLHVVTPSLSVVSSQPSTSTNATESFSNNTITAHLDFDEDVLTRAGNLSSILQKLCLWEKKLYNEVKAEEKMRVRHDRKCRKLKRLDKRGAEAQKVDSTRTLIRSLSTKIRIAIQVVDRISVTINKIRDEELWPQLNDLIQGLTRMWKSMLECHRSQCEAIREARNLGSIGSRKIFSDAHLEATRQLEHELINWTIRFSSWVAFQKGYVKALNKWLLKCLPDEPEEAPDGVAPFSPGRIGAPPVFVICNQWSQALERICEKEVVESMRIFTMCMLHIWEQDRLELRQRSVVNKDLERKVRNLDRDDQKIQKEIQALDRQMVLVSGEGNRFSVSESIIYQSEKSSSLQGTLLHIFDAMEKFTDNCLKAYEELLQRSEEESVAREHGRVS